MLKTTHHVSFKSTLYSENTGERDMQGVNTFSSFRFASMEYKCSLPDFTIAVKTFTTDVRCLRKVLQLTKKFKHCKIL